MKVAEYPTQIDLILNVGVSLTFPENWVNCRVSLWRACSYLLTAIKLKESFVVDSSKSWCGHFACIVKFIAYLLANRKTSK